MSKVVLKWLGHSCWTIDEDGYSIVLDPYEDGSVPGYPPLRVEANQIYCSHKHADHGGEDNGRGIVKLRLDPKRRENPWKVMELHSFHDENNGRDRGTNIIRIFSDGNFRIAHMGDLGCPLTERQSEVLRGLDVMLVPVGGYFTLEPDRIKRIVDDLDPTICVPMHYRSGKYGYSVIGTLEEYTKLCNNVVYHDSNTLLLPDDLKPQTAVMKFIAS